MSGRLDGKDCPQRRLGVRQGEAVKNVLACPLAAGGEVHCVQRERGASDPYRIEGRDRKAGCSHIPLPACAANGHDSIVLRFARSSECSGLLSSKNQP